MPAGHEHTCVRAIEKPVDHLADKSVAACREEETTRVNGGAGKQQHMRETVRPCPRGLSETLSTLRSAPCAYKQRPIKGHLPKQMMPSNLSASRFMAISLMWSKLLDSNTCEATENIYVQGVRQNRDIAILDPLQAAAPSRRQIA